MIHSILKDKPTKLFVSIAAFFVANAHITAQKQLNELATQPWC